MAAEYRYLEGRVSLEHISKLRSSIKQHMQASNCLSLSVIFAVMSIFPLLIGGIYLSNQMKCRAPITKQVFSVFARIYHLEI